ncbi:unnamed protein product [Closterium sp. NIES-54]
MSTTTVVTDPSFESTAASALVAELVDFAAACRLGYTTSLVAESKSDYPPSVGGECALGTDVLEDRQEDFESLAAAVPHLVAMLIAPEGDPDAPDIPTPRSYAEAITGPYSSQSQAAMNAKIASWKSTGTYVDAVPPSGANIVDGMWIFRVKRPPSSPPVFKTRYFARGFSQGLGLRRPPGFTGSFPAGTQSSLRRPVYGLRHAPREWHNTLRTTLAALGFAPSTADPSLFLRTDTSLPPFYVLVYVSNLVFATADTEALALVKSELQKRHTCTDLGPSTLWLPVLLATVQSSAYRSLALSSTFRRVRRAEWPEAAKRVLRYLCSTSDMALVLGGRGPIVLIGHADASWVDDLATQRSSQGYTFSLGSSSVSWRSTRSSSVLSSSCEAEIYAGAMAAQELRWLTYLLTKLGERPRSSLVLYVDNKTVIALCQEHRLEHRTKRIALRYFLAQELQQRDQLRLVYVATQASTADTFTKALQSEQPACCMAPRSPWARQLLREHHAGFVKVRRLEVSKRQNAEIGRESFDSERTQHACAGEVVPEDSVKRVEEHEAVERKRKRDGAADGHGGRTSSRDGETGRSSGSRKSRRRFTTAGDSSEITTTARQPAASCPEGHTALSESRLHCRSSRGAPRASSISPRPSWAAYFHAKLSQGLPLPLPLLHSQEPPLPLPLPLLHPHILPLSLPLDFSRPSLESPESINHSGERGAVGGRQMAEASVGAPSASVPLYAGPAADFVFPDLNLPAAADNASDNATSGAGDGRGRGGGDGGNASNGAYLSAFVDCGHVQSACESDGLDGHICDASSAHGLVTLPTRSCEPRARLQLRQSFGSDFPVLRLHSDRGGEFSSGVLRAFCSARGIRQTFTLPDSPQQNGIAERRIGMVMDVARTSMMHAAAPHFSLPVADP